MTEEQKERMREWIRRLRSGEYRQGLFKLHVIDTNGNHKYCCLGVACEIAAEAGIVTPFVLDTNTLDQEIIAYRKGHYFHDTGLPTFVADWFGLPDDDVIVEGAPLTLLNDNGVSFNEIANILERNYLPEDSQL